MIKGQIQFTGRTLGDVEDAITEALERIKNETTSGFDSNEDSAFTYTVDGEGNALGDAVPWDALGIYTSGLDEGTIAKASVCERSSTRVHQLDTASRCAYCHKELILVAG